MTNLDGVFRREWGPAVAALARWSGDFTVAEDAVQEAFAEALRAWPRDGVPDNAGGWIVAVARNRALDRLRRESVRPGKELAAVVDDIRARTDRVDVHPVRDDELRMIFTCAHPALDPTSQLALTLRLISGLTVAEIARALLQSEAAVGQRITRAKNKIRHANIPLRVPPAELLPERTPHVLACIYSVFTEGYWSTAGPSAIRDELCDEGVRLAGELCSLMPDERDAHALAALVLLHDSRRQTRVDADGALVPLDEQDRSRWDRGRITRGLDRLQLAAGARGPYLPQAVIAALHATAPSWQETDWAAICVAYDRLIEHTHSPVARANRALAIGFRDGFTAGLAALDEVADDPRLARSNTVASIRADLLRRAGRRDEALRWYRVALDRNGSGPAREFLRRRVAECAGHRLMGHGSPVVLLRRRRSPSGRIPSTTRGRACRTRGPCPRPRDRRQTELTAESSRLLVFFARMAVRDGCPFGVFRFEACTPLPTLRAGLPLLRRFVMRFANRNCLRPKIALREARYRPIRLSGITTEVDLYLVPVCDRARRIAGCDLRHANDVALISGNSVSDDSCHHRCQACLTQ